MSGYSPLSIKLSGDIDKQTKKNEGIFFTSQSIVQSCINSVQQFIELTTETSILEPSCGSGEFISALLEINHAMRITGIENNDTIYQEVKHFESPSNPGVTIINDDFLRAVHTSKYNVIIGNPPYFVIKKNTVESVYLDYFDGRPNIFILFIIKSLSLLADNGILCFVLPNNFLNCLYYNKTRQYIHDHFTILNITGATGEFIDTQQETIIMVVQNKVPSASQTTYTMMFGENIIFGSRDSIVEIQSVVKDSTTINNLGLSVNVGNVVWNQKKTQLTDDPQHTRLIYSSDIKNGVVGIEKYKNSEKKNYINSQGIIGKTLLVNRGYGVGKYKFEFALYDSTEPYLIENHIICISGAGVEKLVNSFNDKRTKKFIALYFKNNAINVSELANILPIY
jgi:hypothetical protein